MKTLVTAHLIGNALLLGLFYYWLGRDESNRLYLFESAGIVLLITLGTLWLHGSSLAYFRQRKALLPAKLIPLFALAAILAAIYVGLAHAYNTFGHEAFAIGSYTTMKLRRPVAPSGVMRAFHIIIWMVRWLVVPVLAFPIAAEICNRGWAGFGRRAFRISRRPLFWMECLVLLLLALWVPFKLFFWIPKMRNFNMEAVSMGARIGLGYLLFVVGLLSLEYFTAGGERVQAVTTDAPVT